MVEVRLSRLCPALAYLMAFASVLMASCSTPEFKFVDHPAHCENQLPDEGESDLDCGGACAPCELGQRCNSTADCRDSQCLDGTCQGAGCGDGEQSGNETDQDCGGGACQPCAVGKGCNLASDCQSGVCGEQTCSEPACNDFVTNGSESDIDCGGPDCAKCGFGMSCRTHADCADNDCEAGKCALVCASDSANCDGNPGNGCETDLRTDLDHCGDCETPCSPANASASCVSGACRVDSCVAPFDDCNGDAMDGCETNTKTDVAHCGACAAKPCAALNGDAYCADATCGITCHENFADCDEAPGNGCERDVSRDISNCGGCGTVCTASPGKTAWCRKGQCGETTCAAGRGDCNGDPDDDPAHGGCETDLKTDEGSCGACGANCVVSFGEPQCSAGVCSIKSCSPGLDDCNNDYADGCETNTNTDLGNCGSCGKTCSVANGSPSCVSGACTIKSCSGTNADCNNTATDGCETNTATSPTHCGACTGANVNCNTLFPNGNGQCVNSTCSLTTCATDYSNCDSKASNGCEANIKTDESHCGTCTIACATTGTTSAGNNCLSGLCTPTCSGTLLSCSNPQNGCTINGATDDNNCGGCGKVCNNSSSAHVDAAGNHCKASVCSPSCVKGAWDDCDGVPSNGCERSVGSDVANCGGCNVTCGTANVSGAPVCASGQCTPTCLSGWGNCGTPAAGCGTPLGTLANCRFCGDTCGASQFCTTGGCVSHFDIGVVGTSISAGMGFQSSVVPKLTANHVLTNSKASGRSRIVLVGVTAINPYLTTEFAWYNGILMHSAIEVNSSMSQSYAGIFYLLDDELPATPGTYPVLVQFSTGNGNGTGAFTVTEFQNVQQTGPFVTTTANPSSDVNCSANPPSRAVALTFTQAGSFGYTVIGARAATIATATPGAVVETMNLLQNQPTPLRGVAGYAGPINGNSTLSWSVASCSNAAGVGVVLKRVGD